MYPSSRNLNELLSNAKDILSNALIQNGYFGYVTIEFLPLKVSKDQIKLYCIGVYPFMTLDCSNYLFYLLKGSLKFHESFTFLDSVKPTMNETQVIESCTYNLKKPRRNDLDSSYPMDIMRL